jgi:hypothetical protein
MALYEGAERHRFLEKGWKIALALSPLVLLLPGCAEDECDRAYDLISDCVPPDTPQPTISQASMSLACSGVLYCKSRCINEASCLEIESLQCITDTSCAPLSSSSPAAKLAACFETCGVTFTGADGGQ